MQPISIHNVSKTFATGQAKAALDNVSICFNPGEIHCILGNNAAGKTTLLKIISGLLPADKPTFQQQPATTAAMRKRMGLFLDPSYMAQELTGFENLYLSALLYQVPKFEISKRIELVTEYLLVSPDDLNRSIQSCSLGTKRKLGICSALLHKPDILVLDEPFANLDPVSANLLAELIQEYRNDNRVIIISSHDLLFVEKVASRISVLKEGKLVYDGAMVSFTSNGNNFYNEMIQLLTGHTDQKQTLKNIIA